MSLFQADGLVLRVRSFGEADKIMMILTPDRGKIEAVVKGARRPRNRFLGSSQPFTHLRLMLFTGRSLHQINQAEIVHSFSILREDLLKMAHASYWCEMTEGLLPEDAKEPEVFSLLLQALTMLEHSEDPELLSRGFEIKILSNLGYLPELSSCVGCSQPPLEPLYFSSQAGGIVGACCRGHFADTKPISRQTLEALRYLHDADLSAFNRITAGPELRKDLRTILSHYAEARLERSFKALTFLEGLEGME